MNKSQQIATITLAAAKKMAQAIEAKALEINVPMVFSVMGHDGNTLLVQRMSDVFVTSCDISLNKAYTVCCLCQGTHGITDAVQPSTSLYSLQFTNQQCIVTFGDGLPVILNGKLIDAVGVDGGTVKQDRLLTETALNYFFEL